MSFTLSSNQQIDLAIDHNPITVAMHTSVLEAIALMSQVRGSCTLANSDSALDPNLLEARASCVLVVEETRLIGIFTERDVVRLTATGINLNSLQIADVMTKSPITITKSQFQDVFSILTLFRYHQVRHLPMVDEQGQVLGVVTRESVRRILQPFDLLRVRFIQEVMVTQVIHAAPNDSILHLAQLMAENQVSCVVIAEKQSCLPDSLLTPIGIVTERDIVQFQALELDLQTMEAQTVMSMPLFCLKPEQSLWVAHQEMQRRFIQRLVVTGDRQELLGIVTQTSLLDVMDPIQIYGVVEALQRRTSELEAEKIQILQNRNIQLEQQVHERTASLQLKMHREKLVAGISSRIRQSLNLDEILQSSVNGVRDFLNCDRVVVYQLQPNLDGVIVAESVLPGWTALINRNIIDTCFRVGIADSYLQGQIRTMEDIYQGGLSECHIELLEHFEVKANLVVPILISEQQPGFSCQLHSQLCDHNTGQCLWGLLIAHQCSAPRHWQTEESELLTQLAEQIAIAIQQAQAYQLAQEELKERKRAEQLLQQLNQELEDRVQQRTAALQESQYFVQRIVDTSPNILYIYDLEEQRNIYVNREITIILGYSPEDIVAMGASFLATLIHPEDLAKVLNYHQHLQTAVDGEILEIEYRMKHANGTWRWLNSRESVFARDANNKVKQTIGNATDISDRKQAEADICAALEKERELSQLRSRFISMASHEFRTPLTIISSSAAILETYNHRLSEEKRQQHLQRIQNTVNHMSQLLDDVLTVNLAEIDRLAFKPESLDLVKFCSNLAEELQLSTEQHKIIFVASHNDQPLATLTVAIDQKLMRQILMNLLNNAIKYSPQANIINFDLIFRDADVLIQIQDYGMGIPEEDQAQLFEAFHRAQNVGTIAGTGLGLSIVKSCVDLHKGKIDVSSKIGEGTIFTITIPSSQ